MKALLAKNAAFFVFAFSSLFAIGLQVVIPTNNVQADQPIQNDLDVTFVGFDTENLSDEAKEGLQRIFAGELFEGGQPAGLIKMGMMALAKQNKIGYNPQSVAGRFYAFGQCPSPPNRTEGGGPMEALGSSTFKEDGRTLMTINCLSCHAGIVNGQVVAGLSNSHINQSRPGQPLARGDNFGPYGVWRLGSMLEDPANKGLQLAKHKTELLKLFRSIQLAPVDSQPWWVMKYKSKDYWYADAGPHDAASFSVNFTTPHDRMNEIHAEHVQVVSKALAFARETNSPIYPGTLNAELVKQGADIFHGRVKPQNRTGFRTCKNCHGSYKKYESHSDLSQPGQWVVDYNYSHVIRDVKTDPMYNTVIRKFEPIVEHFNKLLDYYDKQGTPELGAAVSVPKKSGYVAPPLVGVWASAPYFHNGSVPTVEAVLNSKLRPEIWSRPITDVHAYDLEKLGMAYSPVAREAFQASATAAKDKIFLSKEAVNHGAIYDTTTYGHANTGHTFGDSLTARERKAVIEFLKSLSGPEMKPIKDRTRDSLKVTAVSR